jgi:hypothetical protein
MLNDWSWPPAAPNVGKGWASLQQAFVNSVAASKLPWAVAEPASPVRELWEILSPTA